MTPTSTLSDVSRVVAQRYWHWYFLSRPEPLPERLIGADPDFFYESLLGTLGTASGSGGISSDHLRKRSGRRTTAASPT